MEKLKNMIVGFAQTAKAEDFIQQFKKNIEGHTHVAEIFNQKDAIELFTPKNGEATLSGNLIRFVQKHIGGGPAEFLRDLKLMKDDDCLIVIETDDLKKDQIEKARALAKSFDLIQAKHFGDFAVEHLTFSEDHQAEML